MLARRHQIPTLWGKPTCIYGFMKLGCGLRAGRSSAQGGIRAFKKSFAQIDTERRFFCRERVSDKFSEYVTMLFLDSVHWT
jgi:hypothetical protein